MDDTIEVECPECGTRLLVSPEYQNRRGRCKCGEVFVITPVITSKKPRPSVQSGTNRSNVYIPTSPLEEVSTSLPTVRDSKRRKTSNSDRYLTLVVVTVIGVFQGCIVGDYAAHHFPFFGGFAMLGQPYSPARYSLVPGHMLLCGILQGFGGFGIGWILTNLGGDSRSDREQS